jgi:hypothetical protein
MLVGSMKLSAIPKNIMNDIRISVGVNDRRIEHCCRRGMGSSTSSGARNDEGVIANAWAEFFEEDDKSIVAATQTVAALGKLYPLIYVDWAWGYTCDASNENVFASMLRKKLKKTADNAKSFTKD